VPRASFGGPDLAPVRALLADGLGPSTMPPVATSVLALGHSAPRPWCGGDDFPADPPANGARVGGGRRHRLGGRARRERTRFRCHAAAVSASARPPGASTGGGEVLLLSVLNYRIVPSLGLDKLSLVAFGVVLDTVAGPSLVRRSALAPDWLRQVVTPKKEKRVRLRDANNARLSTSGTVTLWLQPGARIIPATTRPAYPTQSGGRRARPCRRVVLSGNTRPGRKPRRAHTHGVDRGKTPRATNTSCVTGSLLARVEGLKATLTPRPLIPSVPLTPSDNPASDTLKGPSENPPSDTLKGTSDNPPLRAHGASLSGGRSSFGHRLE